MSLEVHIRKKEQNRTLDVNFKAEKGILSILGETGSGKTELLSCLAGLQTPDEGSIVLNGRPLYDSLQKICLPPAQRKTGFLPESYALFPEMTVEENIRLVLGTAENPPGRADGKKEGRRERKLLAAMRTTELLKEYGLDGLGGCYPDELSRAQRLMAAMARMMAAEPELVLLDNPFAGLDPYLRAELLQRIREKLTSEKGVTCVFATADRDEAYAMGGSIVSMENGACTGEKKRDLFFHAPETVGAALLSGCHNIAKAERLDDFHALVPAWGAVLVFSGEKRIPQAGEAVSPQEAHGWEELSGDFAFVGIREEDFCLRIPEGRKAADFRRFPVLVQRVEEDLQSWRIWFATGREARRLELSGKASGSGSSSSEPNAGTETEREAATGNLEGKDKKNGESSDKADKEGGRSSEEPAESLLLWKVSKREISREEIWRIRRLYIENRQIMRLTAPKRG